MRMIDMYADFATGTLAMPVVAGRKSRIESFAGANCTYTIEAMMGDLKALQAGTSHNLGQNFAKVGEEGVRRGKVSRGVSEEWGAARGKCEER